LTADIFDEKDAACLGGDGERRGFGSCKYFASGLLIATRLIPRYGEPIPTRTLSFALIHKLQCHP
jgi:hypothetical protein